MKTLLAQSSALTLAIAALAPLPLMAQTASTDTTGENMFEAENDPYIWLEEARDEKALAWVEDQLEGLPAGHTPSQAIERLVVGLRSGSLLERVTEVVALQGVLA